MIGSNWIAKLLITLLSIPQYFLIIIDFGITFYISLSILIFSLTVITTYKIYIESYVNIFNIGVIISIIIGLISLIVMIKSNKNKNNRIELIVEYLYYELSLIPISAEIRYSYYYIIINRKMIKNDKTSVTYQTDKRAVQYEELLERICKLKNDFGEDISQFIHDYKSVIYNKLENDERFKIFEKDVEKSTEIEEKVGSFTMMYYTLVYILF